MSEMAKQKMKKAAKEVGIRILHIREYLNINQTDLGAPSLISKHTISNYESGKAEQGPPYNFIRSLIVDFKVNPYFLLLGQGDIFTEEPPSPPKKKKFRGNYKIKIKG